MPTTQNHTPPLQLTPERVWRTYRGGGLLDSLHGISGEGDGHFPEEWIMSVVVARNAGREDIVEGPSRLVGRPEITLKDMVAENPRAMLGGEHVEKHGPTPGVLVKLIDSSERLTIQAHPDKAHARELFHSEYGKTECWHILGGRTIDGKAPCVYLGFKEGITAGRWKKLFDEQDIQGMLDSLHKFDVHQGETILIEGGVPHAIGAGCFLVEIQEPTDYTIRVERVTPSGFPVADALCHQGLGFDRMFDCFTYEGISRERARERWFVQPATLSNTLNGNIQSLISYGRCPYFRLERIDVKKDFNLPYSPVFSGLYTLEGKGDILVEGKRFPLERGAQYFLPAAIPELVIHNEGRAPLVILRFFGPK